MNTWFDLALVLLYAVGWFVVEWLRLPAVRVRMAAAPPGARANEYLVTIVVQWILAGLVVARLVLGHRPLAAIGLGLPHGFVGWGVTAAAIALVLWLTRAQAQAARSERGRAAIARAVAGMAWWLPRQRREFATFGALSITAGVCEETMFRGHLFATLDGWMGPVLATLVGVAAFAIGHAYQGREGVQRVAMVGLFMAIVYRASGSLLAPIVTHALIDLAGGRLVEAVVRQGYDLEALTTHAGAGATPGSAPAAG